MSKHTSVSSVYRGESCVLCGDDLTNDLERDTGVCDACSEAGSDE